MSARLPLFDPAPWRQQAACRGVAPELFFPDHGSPTLDAKRVCATCPVRGECLDFALANNETFGIWGGLSQKQRIKLRRQRPATPAAATVELAAGPPDGACPHGHPWTPENTYLEPGTGKPRCRTCGRDRATERRRRRGQPDRDTYLQNRRAS